MIQALCSRRGVVFVPLLAVLIGIFIGIGVYTFGYAQGASYMTNDPAACANCHIMREQYEGWMKGSHGKAAVCNDCHTPAGIFGKYMTKALNGFNHSLAFTTQNFPENIRITSRNYRITNEACLKCHEQIVDNIRMPRDHREDVSCIGCHRTVGHE